MVRGLALVVLVIAALGCCASEAAATDRPGATTWTREGLPGSSILTIEATPTSRFLVAAVPMPASPIQHEAWVRAFRPDGSTDPSFGDGGTLTFADQARALVDTVVQPDGRILLAQGAHPAKPNLVQRLTPAGQPDPSFGTDGQTEPKLGPGNDALLVSVTLQPDGRLVLTGIRSDTSIVVSRLLADGSPDTSFGSGGHAVISPGADTWPGVGLQPDGGIVLVAVRGDRVVAGRLTSTGALDPSFGGGAGLTPVQFAQADWPKRLSVNLRWAAPLVLPSGRIRLGVAVARRSEPDRSSVLGLTASGHPDLGFGNHGLALGGPPLRSADDPGPSDGGESPSTLVGDQRGGLLVVSTMGTSSEDLASEARTTIRRFRPDGTLDRSFGSHGGVRLDWIYPPYTAVEDAAGLVGDRLVVGEHSWNGKYGGYHTTRLRALYAGYDDDRPTVWLTAGCRYLRVRVRDLSGLDAVVVRGGGHVLRRTRAKRFRVKLPDGARRAAVTATDLAGNASRKRSRLPRC